jgi:hypothetical protein
MDSISFGIDTRNIVVERTTQSSFTSTIATGRQYYAAPLWLAIRVNSSTDVDFLYSQDGVIWMELVNARNPGITIGSVGIALKSEDNVRFGGAFDYLRIWESALSLPGSSA